MCHYNYLGSEVYISCTINGNSFVPARAALGEIQAGRPCIFESTPRQSPVFTQHCVPSALGVQTVSPHPPPPLGRSFHPPPYVAQVIADRLSLQPARYGLGYVAAKVRIGAKTGEEGSPDLSLLT